jgi:Protein of unknown function (DUF3375)
VLGSRESITGSDQGRSFQAFYDFLLSSARQQELSELLDRVHELSGNTESDPRLRRVHHDWLQAAGAAQATVRQLSEQLRRFLDDQVWFENRRVIDLLRGIEARALALRDERAIDLVVELDASSPEIRLPTERPLYTPVRKPRIDSSPVRPAGSGDETDPSALFEQVYVDPDLLRGNVRAALRRHQQIGLAELIIQEPLAQGLAELVSYLALRDEAFETAYDKTTHGQVRWTGPDGHSRTVTLPRVTFTRTANGTVAGSNP